MASVILTKLMAPQVSLSMLRRRLLAKIEAAGGARLILVQAGAGYGKTSLVSSYVQVARLPYLWYQLDGEDAEPVTFIRHLEEGWRGLGARWPVEPLASRLVSAGFGGESIQDFLAAFVKAVNLLPERVLLIFEDYHLVQHSEFVNRLIERLVPYLPPKVRLFITSRTPPPLPLARYRARGWLAEITAEDLRFTRSEAADFLRELALGEEALDRVLQRTEGWAAGLALFRYAALSGVLPPTGESPRPLGSGPAQDEGESLFSEAPAAGFVAYIDEYLKEEVMRGLPAEQQAFLEKTCILDFPEPEICEALTGGREAARHLAALAENNLFVSALGGGRAYRYHQLLRDYLHRCLKTRLGDDGLRELHARAASAYLRRGDRAQAVAHLFQAGDVPRLVSLLLELAPVLLEGGNYAVLRRWLQKLPEKVVQASPQLLFYRGLGRGRRRFPAGRHRQPGAG
jgi:LuxR family maltose regulon positive regulatory protein